MSRILSSTCLGLNSFLVEVEADIQRSLPRFTIVGLADTQIQEAKERVKAAMMNSSLDYPKGAIAINLAPADLKKIGNHFDLPIALAILQEENVIPGSGEIFKDSIFVGELAFDGSLRRINNIISICIYAKENNYKNIYLPIDNASEASVIKDINIYPISNLSEIAKYLKSKTKIEKFINNEKIVSDEIELDNYDFCLIRGQESAKRAVIVACAGSHNISMTGVPGSGKTFIAKSIPSILPDLSEKEVLEVSRIYSSIGLLNKNRPLITKRPFRSPHHSSSLVSLIGGGGIPRPGEVSLSHRGVLFLDELPEFPKKNLETLRQPLEDGSVIIARAQITLEFPSKFMLVTAQNPCPCGFFGDDKKQCTCTNSQIKLYQQKISGPLLDRIDIHLTINRVKHDELEKTDENTSTVKKQIIEAREIQKQRFLSDEIITNSEMNLRLIKKYCQIPEEARRLLSIAVEKYNLSARGYFRILKVSRTIADLENSENIKLEHVAEALQYRKIEN